MDMCKCMENVTVDKHQTDNRIPIISGEEGQGGIYLYYWYLYIKQLKQMTFNKTNV